MDRDLQQRTDVALNRLAKWRTVFAGWLLGTRPGGDPQSEWARDNSDARLMLRVEVTAITSLLLQKGIITVDDFNAQLIKECTHQHEMLERKFPGIRATDSGVTFTLPEAHETMKDWLP